MKNKLINIMIDINTMTVAGITVFAKEGNVISASDVREFAQNWSDQLEDNLSQLRGLLDDD